jgi:hypothetical protein
MLTATHDTSIHTYIQVLFTDPVFANGFVSRDYPCTELGVLHESEFKMWVAIAAEAVQWRIQVVIYDLSNIVCGVTALCTSLYKYCCTLVHSQTVS